MEALVKSWPEVELDAIFELADMLAPWWTIWLEATSDLGVENLFSRQVLPELMLKVDLDICPATRKEVTTKASSKT